MPTHILRYHPITFAFIPRKQNRRQNKFTNFRFALNSRRIKKLIRQYLRESDLY